MTNCLKFHARNFWKKDSTTFAYINKKKIKVWIFEDPQMIECIFISLFHVSILSRNFNLRLTYYDYLYNILSLPKHWQIF